VVFFSLWRGSWVTSYHMVAGELRLQVEELESKVKEREKKKTCERDEGYHGS